jgi:hypothetical protein
MERKPMNALLNAHVSGRLATLARGEFKLTK